MMQCYYCKDNTQESYVIRKALKPKGVYKRWKDVGYCCETCYLEDKKISFEYGEEFK